MIFKSTSDHTADFVSVLFKNVDGGGSVTQGTAACFATDGSSIDHLSGTNPATASLKAAAGIATETVAINATKLVLAWGYINSILISNEGSSVTITAGDALTLVAGSVGMSSVGGETVTKGAMGWCTSGSTETYSAAGYADKCLVRLLN